MLILALNKWLKRGHFFALANSTLIWFIYTINKPNEGANSIFMPWDGYVNKNNINLIDLNTLSLRAFSGVHSLPDYLWSLFISDFLQYGFFAIILPIFILSLIHI